MDNYVLAASQIVKEQQAIVGPLAVDQAKRVTGLEIDSGGKIVKISGNGKEVLEKLVQQFENLFGRASVEACKEAIKEITPQIPKQDLPAILQ